MRTQFLVCSIAFVAACGSSKSGSTIMCGPGTTLQGDTCVGGPDGSVETCGAGTVDQNGTCVPVDAPVTSSGAPTITGITPDHAGISGFVLFTIDGTGFAGSDVSDLHVYFGDTTPGMTGQLGPCEAQIGAATATEITGEVPPGCDVNVTVTVATNLGMATVPFHYDTLFAAGGRDSAGLLFVIDPTVGLWGVMGPLADAGGTSYGLSGLAFAADGTLYGSATLPSDELVKIDLTSCKTGTCAVTAVGAFTDGTNTYRVADLKFSGANLYGMTAAGSSGAAGALVQIDPASGAVTLLGTAATGTNDGGGFAVLGDGTLVTADAGGNGALSSVDPATGALTAIATMDYPDASPITAMTTFGTTLLAAVSNGNGSLISVDTTTAQTQWWFELPAMEGQSGQIDAIDMAPAATTIAHMRKIHFQAPPARSAARPACTGTVAVHGGTVARVVPAHGDAISLANVATGAVTVATCGGQAMTIAGGERGHYAIRTNRRGLAKLVDTRTGRTVLRGVASITRR